MVVVARVEWVRWRNIQKMRRDALREDDVHIDAIMIKTYNRMIID